MTQYAVGDFVEASNTSGVNANLNGVTLVTSITLSAGDWDVSANTSAVVTSSFTLTNDSQASISAGVSSETTVLTGLEGKQYVSLQTNLSASIVAVLPTSVFFPIQVGSQGVTLYLLSQQTSNELDSTSVSGYVVARRIR